MESIKSQMLSDLKQNLAKCGQEEEHIKDYLGSYGKTTEIYTGGIKPEHSLVGRIEYPHRASYADPRGIIRMRRL